MNSNARGVLPQGQMKVMRCPYFVEQGMFKEMTVGGSKGWHVCGHCGHLAQALDLSYECHCAKCMRLRISH